jgi:D-arabinose 1-dehydrogenase-like Zn-dependent alcohol dehydrogenase
VINDMKKWSDFKKQEITPKQFNDNDIDIKIECCGVCGSDVHTITGGWGDAPLPICVGHEVIGKAVKVGSKVKTVRGPSPRAGSLNSLHSILTPSCRSKSEIESAAVPKSGRA